ncbi:MAG: NAD(P)-binding protein [Neisseriaceae bacterium]|nr:NAD(P)-binding protein [Neisseriaceae bacterium]
MNITRRDFLNGVALTIAAGLTPIQQLLQASSLATATLESGQDYYPPALMGMRGNHPGSFEPAHALARAGVRFDTTGPIEETYDLVVVGAGISGLAAAFFYRQQFGPDKKVLILDNHDDFGGHAKRNEFSTDEGMVLGYGGSESLQSPRSIYSPIATKLIEDLGIDLTRLESHFDVNFYPDLGLSKGVFFDKAHFGVNKIVSGDPGHGVADDIPINRLNGRSYREFISDFPLPKQDREDLIKLHEETVDYLAGMSTEEKVDYLDRHSYTQFLRDKVKLSKRAILYFQQQTSDFQGVGIDATACSDARLCALPGFEAMNLPPLDEESQAELDDLYIHHFPDGNATIARLLVRRLIPAVALGDTMEDVVLAKFDYSKLDQPKSPTRLRLNATVVRADNASDNTVVLAYARGDKVHRVKAKYAIMAGYNMMIPSIVPTMPQVQQDALHQNVKAPLVYSKVVIKNWQAFKKLGVHSVYSPTAPYSLVKLDYPVSMGGYEHSKSPDQPMCLHMVYVPIMAGSGLPAREQSRMGRANLLATSFEEHEQMIRDQLQAMLGEEGFNHETDILGITVNRWSHGYSYTVNTLFDDEDEAEKIIETARQPFGNIHIANSDANWGPYAHEAMDAAHRAIAEVAEKLVLTQGGVA